MALAVVGYALFYTGASNLFTGGKGWGFLQSLLNKGEINALVVQNPVKMGHDGVKVLLDYIKTKAKQQNEDTGATLVTKANLSDPKVADLVAPAKE